MPATLRAGANLSLLVGQLLQPVSVIALRWAERDGTLFIAMAMEEVESLYFQNRWGSFWDKDCVFSIPSQACTIYTKWQNISTGRLTGSTTPEAAKSSVY